MWWSVMWASLTIFTASDPHTASLTMTKLQNPIREGFDAVTEDLRKVSKVQKDFGRSLDKVRGSQSTAPAGS